MKVLFIFPPLTMEERYSKRVGSVGGYLAPLGLAYMASVLLREGHDVKITDAPALGFTNTDVLKEIGKWEPDFIGMTALTSMIQRVSELGRKIKEQHPDTVLGIGGPHATIMPRETLRDTKADFVIMGEGEITIPDALRNVRKSKKAGIIQGKPVEDLDSIPFPARDLLPMERYTALPNNYKRDPHTINMITSRGCPYQCTFCCKAIYGMRYRLRSVGNVMEEIRQVAEKYNAKEIAFWDDLFTMRRKWVMGLCDEILKEGLDIAWSCETRVNMVDREMLAKMKRAGCWNIFYGIEAGDQRLLDNIQKGTTLEQARKAVRITKQSGIEVRGSFMIALPGETPELARSTIRFAIELDPDYAQFTVTTPFPGTRLYNEASKWGRLSRRFNEYNEWNPVFVPRGYRDAEEVKEIHREAFRRFYMRPGYILKRISRTRSLSDFRRNLTGLKMIMGFR